MIRTGHGIRRAMEDCFNAVRERYYGRCNQQGQSGAWVVVIMRLNGTWRARHDTWDEINA